MSATAAISRSARSLRIIALPLTGSRAPAGTLGLKHADHLIYYHFVTPPPPPHALNGWSRRATTKAAEVWAAFGKSPEGSWKRRVYLYGERLVDRVDFEELALKSVDPSLGPSLNSAPHLRPADHPTIPLVYPASVCPAPLSHLRELLAQRTPRHRKGFFMWMAIMPLTAPLKLIPIIPNLPFFFCAWRAWSHYRAYKASQYLQAFLNQGAIIAESSAVLDATYAEYALDQTKAKSDKDLDDASSTAHAPRRDSTVGIPLLLSPAAVPVLEQRLALPPGSPFIGDMYRALEQARLRLQSAARSR